MRSNWGNKRGLDRFASDCPPFKVIDSETRECLYERGAARKFIYEHWMAKSKGYVSIGFPCVDCSPVTHYFVEPDEDSRWLIVMTFEMNGPLSTSKAVKLRFRHATKVEVSQGYPSILLSFIDKFGKEIDAF